MLSDTPLTAEQAWEVEGITVLRATVNLPQCDGKGKRVKRFNRYYRDYCRAYLRYCALELLPRAEAHCRAAWDSAAPWEIMRADLRYCVTMQREGLLSLYTQSRETDGPPPQLIIRRADTWDMERAYLHPISDFFPPKYKVGAALRKLAKQQIRTQMEQGIAMYYSDYQVGLRRCFSDRNFYLSEEGVVCFYPMYSIAPSFEGIVTFTLPYEENGAHLPLQLSVKS